MPAQSTCLACPVDMFFRDSRHVLPAQSTCFSCSVDMFCLPSRHVFLPSRHVFPAQSTCFSGTVDMFCLPSRQVSPAQSTDFLRCPVDNLCLASRLNFCCPGMIGVVCPHVDEGGPTRWGVWCRVSSARMWMRAQPTSWICVVSSVWDGLVWSALMWMKAGDQAGVVGCARM